jgi:hypothetical protein
VHRACLPCLRACSKYLYLTNIAAPWHGAAGDSTGGHRRRRRGLLGTAIEAVSEQSVALEPLFAAGIAGSTAAVAAGRSLKVRLEYPATTVAVEVQVVCCVL